MNDKKDDGMPGDLLPPEVWRPEAIQHLARAQEQWEEKFDIATVQTHTPDLWQRIIEKFQELEQLELASEETVLRLLRQIEGLFGQALYHRRGYTEAEMALDPDGTVIAVRIHGRDFGPERQHLKRMIGAWVSTDPDFRAPDGGLIYQLEEFETLLTMSEADQIEFLASKFH